MIINNSNILYYLWKDKRGIFYITDYKEINKEGKVKVDNYGFIEAEEMFSSKVKNDLISYAQNLTLNK